jgi:alpha-L-fucosidase
LNPRREWIKNRERMTNEQYQKYFDRINLAGMAGKVKYAQFLHDASEIRFGPGRGEGSGDLALALPVRKPPVEIPVLEIFLK